MKLLVRIVFMYRRTLQSAAHCRIYRYIGEIGSVLYQSESRYYVLIGPASDMPIPKKEWCRLASVLAATACSGTKIIAVSPPRGKEAHERSRIDLNQTLEHAKLVAVLAKQNIVSYIPAIESVMEAPKSTQKKF